jgi:hypothetical protein
VLRILLLVVRADLFLYKEQEGIRGNLKTTTGKPKEEDASSGEDEKV